MAMDLYNLHLYYVVHPMTSMITYTIPPHGAWKKVEALYITVSGFLAVITRAPPQFFAVPQNMYPWQ